MCHHSLEVLFAREKSRRRSNGLPSGSCVRSPMAWMRQLGLGEIVLTYARVLAAAKGSFAPLRRAFLDDPVQQLVDPADAFKGLNEIQRIKSHSGVSAGSLSWSTVLPPRI